MTAIGYAMLAGVVALTIGLVWGMVWSMRCPPPPDDDGPWNRERDLAQKWGEATARTLVHEEAIRGRVLRRER